MNTERTYFLETTDGLFRFLELPAPDTATWFRRLLRAAARRDAWYELDEWEALGEPPYGLGVVFDRARDGEFDVPSDDESLRALLERNLYFERDLDVRPGFVHVETDDDEATNVEYFIFDDEFLASEQAALLLPHPSVADEQSDEAGLLDPLPSRDSRVRREGWEAYRELTREIFP